VREAAALVSGQAGQPGQRLSSWSWKLLQPLIALYAALTRSMKASSTQSRRRFALHEVDFNAVWPAGVDQQQRRRGFSPLRFIEGGLTIVIIAALLIAWLALTHLPRSASVGQQKTPAAPLIYRSYTGGLYGGVSKLAWSPDGTQIASVNVDGSLRVWSASTGQTLARYTSPVGFVKVLSMAWLPNNYLLILSERADNTIDAWSPFTGEVYMSMSLPTTIYAGAWSPDGSRIAFDDGHHAVQVWSVFPEKKIALYPVHTIDRIAALSWSPNGAQIASATYDGVIAVWDAATGKNVLSPYTSAGQVVSLSWSPDASRLGWATATGVIQLWNENLKQSAITLRGATGTIMPEVALSWSSNSIYLAASDANLVQVWDTITSKQIFTYRGHTDGVNDVAWSPGGAKIASASLDKTVQVWQIA
jgi:WD40 repeat protein